MTIIHCYNTPSPSHNALVGFVASFNSIAVKAVILKDTDEVSVFHAWQSVVNPATILPECSRFANALRWYFH